MKAPTPVIIRGALGALLALLAQAPAEAGMIDKEGMAPWEICGLCHSLDGVSPMAKFPKLAGQKATYIVQQFGDFRSGARSNDGGQMEAITAEVEEGELDAIAGYFSRLPAPPPEAVSGVSGELLAAGERLYTAGREGLPACASCHRMPANSAPWLEAQHADYLAKQLRDFQSGARRGGAGGLMNKVAGSLSEADIAALAAYLQASPREAASGEK